MQSSSCFWNFILLC